MARQKKHAEHVNHERWLISYADFITLLFAFFVVMFASSQTDKTKAQQISAAVKDALEHGGVPAVVHEILGGTVDDKGKGNAMMKGPGGAEKQLPAKTDIPESKVTVTDLMPSMAYLTRALAQEIKDGKVEVHLDARGLVISLRQAAFFPSGGDDVSLTGLKSIETIAKTVRSVPNPVRLEGHTDSIPMHSQRFPSNWELSTARSIAMLQLFTGRYGISADRFSVAGYAETKPIDSNESAEGRAHNRRVDIVILDQTVVVKQAGQAPVAKKAAH
jgi:chemotaxis protein MotB